MSGNQRFSITPSRAVEDTNMPDTIFRTLAALGLYGDKNGWCYPSLTTLANIRGLSKPAISQHTKWLKDNGYLNVSHRYTDKGAQTSNLYQIRFDYPPPLSPELNPPLSPELNPPLSPGLNHNAPSNAPEEPLRGTPPAGAFVSKFANTKLHKMYSSFLRYRKDTDPDFKDPRLYHPALRLWRGIYELDVTPKGDWRDTIIREVGEKKADLKTWRDSMNVWAGVSSNKNAPMRVLSIFKNGGVLDDLENFERNQENMKKGDRVPNPLSLQATSDRMAKWLELQNSGLLDKQAEGANK